MKTIEVEAIAEKSITPQVEEALRALLDNRSLLSSRRPHEAELKAALTRLTALAATDTGGAASLRRILPLVTGNQGLCGLSLDSHLRLDVITVVTWVLTQGSIRPVNDAFDGVGKL